MKINIGCGRELKEGWINADNTVKEVTKLWQMEQRRAGFEVIDMDGTKPWLFKDETFDYVFSEHMIEHVPEKAGLFMLQEALRTLKLGGVIRIACPDREKFESLVGQDDHPYVKEFYRVIFNRAPPKGAGARVSKAVIFEKGHVWVPTAQQLIDQIEKAGFSDVKQVENRISEHEALNGIEYSKGKHLELRKWDTLSVEGTKNG